MRLTCPSCGAQYEVDDSVIPESGRDVQCSNCGHAWFQMPAKRPSVGHAAEKTSEEAPGLAEPPRPEARAMAPDEPTPPESASTQASATTPRAHDADIDDAEDEPADEDAMPAPPPRKIDESVLSVLREEAERERRAREAERGGIETQTDLGLTAAAPARSASTDGAQPAATGSEQAAETPESGKGTGNKVALPDIEEIKSTLRASSERGDEPAAMDAPEAVAQRDRRGFRLGFSLALLLAVCLVAVYLFAPQLAERFPALKSGLATYAQGVDGARMWLDARMQDLTTALQGD
ncbi:putative Zn finger-like uncharacterized protein [Albidovulum inexpectatum]|uniref:Putative Zn finger-like uncharacterized protein n=1 Tax=Albidovulum inexpectatum TaxID=196587 RepID=A0A2S5JGQ8_9RHOB|nr:zinc-ribbon domain-containing protein [Albidovulum inexpectatum]PPB80538.1 putative Zn finger-like uncharacterized protein [Albidovulum inexpectatum]